MKELVLYITKKLVENPDKVNVTTKTEGTNNILSIFVEPSDRGRIIGKNGKIIKAIRTLIQSSAIKTKKKWMVEVAE